MASLDDSSCGWRARPMCGAWRSRAGRFAGAGMVSCASTAAFAAPVFTGLGVGPGWSEARDVSADGAVVVGTRGPAPRAFRWSAAGGLEELPTSPGFGSGFGNCAGNGGLVGGEVVSGPPGAQTIRAVRWVGGVGATPSFLGVLPGYPSTRSTDMTPDGAVIVGFAQNLDGSGPFRSWRWTAAGGLQDLGLGGGAYAEIVISGISANGAVAVGSGVLAGPPRPVAWYLGAGFEDLGLLAGGTSAAAVRASADGSSIVGYGDSSFGPGLRGILWAGAGAEDLGEFVPLGVSDGGNVVVGYAIGGASGTIATIWRAGVGARSLQAELQDRGLSLPGWALVSANGVSADGTVIVGDGVNPGGAREAWHVVLDGAGACRIDYNGDTEIDFSDVEGFLLAYNAQIPGNAAPGADLNNDTEFDFSDIEVFLALFNAGC